MARLAHYLMASEWRAALIASLLLFLPLLSWAGASVVALYALRRGLGQSLMVTAVPMLAAIVMAFLGYFGEWLTLLPSELLVGEACARVNEGWSYMVKLDDFV